MASVMRQTGIRNETGATHTHLKKLGMRGSIVGKHTMS